MLMCSVPILMFRVLCLCALCVHVSASVELYEPLCVRVRSSVLR